MMRLFLVGLSLALGLFVGCSKSAMDKTDTKLRYTVWDSTGTRSSRNRESVLKTVEMPPDQIPAWAKEGTELEDRRATTQLPHIQSEKLRITIRTVRGRFSGQDENSVSKASKMDFDQIRKWVEEDEGGREGRSATLYLGGGVKVIWHGSSGQLLYTWRNDNGSQTSRDEKSASRASGMKHDQIRMWAEDEAGAAEGRCATFCVGGHMEGISRGVLQEPPWEE